MTPPVRRIDSTANPSVKAWHSLRKRRERDRRRLGLVEGERELARALAGGVTFEAVLTTTDRSPALERLAATIAEDGADPYELSEAALGRVSLRANPAGIIGVARTPERRLDMLDLPPTPLVVIADALEKPGNVGALIRSADGAGADAIVLSDPVTDLMNPNLIRASQGAVFTAPLATASAREVAAWLERHAIRPVAASPDAATDLWAADLSQATAVVIGSEHAGISPLWQQVTTIRIPMHGTSDSLNASVAAAVILYEAVRQRTVDQYQ